MRLPELGGVDTPKPCSEATTEEHLGRNTWFAGDAISIADFQMRFAVGATLARNANTVQYVNLAAYRERMVASWAEQRGIAKGGSVVMS